GIFRRSTQFVFGWEWCTRNSLTQCVGLFFYCNNRGCRNSLCTIGGREQLVPAVLRPGRQKRPCGAFLERGRVPGEAPGQQRATGVESYGVSRRGGFAFGLHARRTRTAVKATAACGGNREPEQ